MDFSRRRALGILAAAGLAATSSPRSTAEFRKTVSESLPDTVLFQNGDDLTESNLARLLARSNSSDYVERGLRFSADYRDNTLTIGNGMAVVADSSTNRAYVVLTEQRQNISLPITSGANYVYLTIDPSTRDAVSIHIVGDDSSPSNPSLKIGEIDTANGTSTELNREPDLMVGDITSDGTTVYDADTNTVGDGTTRANHESVHAEDVGNIHYLPEVNGGTLNAKWDTLTSGWRDGESHAVIIPPPDQDNDGSRDDTVTLGNGIVCWEMDGAITIDNDRDNVVIKAWRSNISHDPANSFTNYIEVIDGSNKPENIDIQGGIWRCNGGVTNLVKTTGASRLRLHGLKGGATSSGNFQRGVYAVADDHPIGGLQVNTLQGAVFDNSTVVLDGTSNSVINFHVEGVRGSGNQDVVVGRGQSEQGDIERVRQTATNMPTRSGVRLEATSDGRPDNVKVEDVAVFTSGVAALDTGDTTRGSASRMREISCERLAVGNNETVASLDWLQGCPALNIGGTDLSWTIDVGVNSNMFDCGIDARGSDVTVNRGANAARIVVNGKGINSGDPSSTGQWNGNGYEGLNVEDTTVPAMYYHDGSGFEAY
ncbi:hypothetical protein [Haloarchaeobius litoreus]|uniref:Uncharacterized protein n=1 Tax=Haloarchaeobius litoreus TaxID=755306 RepID=A0ABD6DL01_9EURY|nr:hypothetical protein [Haloarchaeobius litoreus]